MTTALAEVAVATTPSAARRPRSPAARSAWTSISRATAASALAGDLIGELEAAGLRGRGGAGFPVAAKVQRRRFAARPARRGDQCRRGRASEPQGQAPDRPAPAPCDRRSGRARRGDRCPRCAHRTRRRARNERATRLTVRRVGRRRRLHDRVTVDRRRSARRLRHGSGDGAHRFLNGGPALPTFTPPRPFESGVGKTADAGPERRDGRPRRADRAPRCRLVPPGRQRRRARHGAVQPVRCGRAARCLRGGARSSVSRRSSAAAGGPRPACARRSRSVATPAPGSTRARQSGLTLDEKCLGFHGGTLGSRNGRRAPRRSLRRLRDGADRALPGSRERRSVRSVRPRPRRAGGRAQRASRPRSARPPRRRGAGQRRLPAPRRRREARRVGPLGLRARARRPRPTIVQSGRPPAFRSRIEVTDEQVPAREPDRLPGTRSLRRAVSRAHPSRRLGLPDHRARPDPVRARASRAARRRCLPVLALALVAAERAGSHELSP